MKEIWRKLEIFHKGFLISTALAVLITIICACLVTINTSLLYGALLGTLLLIVSNTIIWVFWYKIPPIKTMMAKSTPWLAPFIRVVIYITVLLLIIFLVNDSSTSWNQVTTPINTFVLLIVYTITPISYGVVVVIEIILNKKQKEKGGGQ